MGHWNTARAVLGRIDDPASPRNTPGLVVAPSSPDPPQLGTNPKLDIDIRFKEQDRKIDEMHRLLKAFEHRFANSLGGHTTVADHNPTGLPNSENSEEEVQSSVANRSSMYKKKKDRKNTISRGPHTSTDSANSSPAMTNGGRPPNLYNAIYSTLTTIGSPIFEQATPGCSLSPLSPLPEDFPPPSEE